MADVVWRVSRDTYRKVVELLDLMDSEDEWSEPYMELLDQVESLPGYPLSRDKNHDTLVVEEVRSIASLPGLNVFH